jgi:hypothetical protein
MGQRIASSFFSTNAPGSFGTFAGETAVATVGPLSGAIADAAVFIAWYFSFTQGSAGGSGVVTRIRRANGLVGPQITAALQVPLAPGIVGQFSGSFADNPGVVGGVFYTLTITAAGQSGTNPTLSDLSLLAYIL